MHSSWRLGGCLALFVLSNGALIVAEEAVPASALKVENLLAPKRARFFFFSSDQPAVQFRHRIAPPTGKLEFKTIRFSRKDAADSPIKTSSCQVELEGDQVRLRGNGFEIDASYVIQRLDAAALSGRLLQVRRTPSSAEFEWGDLSGDFSRLFLFDENRSLVIEPAEDGNLRIKYAPSTVIYCRAMEVHLDSQALKILFGPGGLE